MPKRPQTLKRGGDDDRARIKAHIKRMSVILALDNRHINREYIRKDTLLDWIDTISNRARDKKGGL